VQYSSHLSPLMPTLHGGVVEMEMRHTSEGSTGQRSQSKQNKATNHTIPPGPWPRQPCGGTEHLYFPEVVTSTRPHPPVGDQAGGCPDSQ
jgi:hypothetical protein